MGKEALTNDPMSSRSVPNLKISIIVCPSWADFLSQGLDARFGDLRKKLHPESCSPLQLNKKIICKLGLFRV